MTYHTLSVEDDAGITRLTLDRAAKKNALSGQMIEELTDFAQTHGAAARVVHLRGAGDIFCAGGDLGWMQAQIQADRATRMAEARRLAMMLNALNEMPAPLIAEIRGGAFGGGVGLACVADVAIAAEGTRFGLTETRLGLIPATIAPYVIARMGEGRARRVFMSSRLFSAEEAVSLGIVAQVCAPDQIDAAIHAEIAPYLRVAPGAVASAKRLARALGPPIDAAVIEDTIQRLAATWETAEAAEGIAAFLEKRPPSWS